MKFEEVSSNEDLERLMAAGEPYDLIFPSDYLIERLLKVGALHELKIPAEQLGRLVGWAREEPYDRGCRWSVPFAFGTTGYLCDPAKVSDDSTWATLFDPSGEGRVGMLDEVREVVGAALIAAGHDPNDVAEGALSAARDLLEAQRPRVARYDSDDFTGPVVSGEVAAHQAWSGPASLAVAANPHLRYVVPSDGAIMWVTSAAIPADAPEPSLSVAFLTELMDPELAARTTLENGYATPNQAARALMPEEVRNRPALFADEATLAECFRLHDLGEGEGLLATAIPWLLS